MFEFKIQQVYVIYLRFSHSLPLCQLLFCKNKTKQKPYRCLQINNVGLYARPPFKMSCQSHP